MIIRSGNTVANEMSLYVNKIRGYIPLLGVKSKALTAKGVNRAIEQNSDMENWFESDEAMEKAWREGWISFHSDGFILWQEMYI